MPLSTIPPAGVSTGAPTWDASGNVAVVLPTGSIGYGTGSGGTVTQLTNKSTAVTLNKPTGQITTNNAALAAGGKVVFAVNNTFCNANDIACVSVGLATSSQAYRVTVPYTYATGFYVQLENTSGVSLSEAVPINFAIIKGATA